MKQGIAVTLAVTIMLAISTPLRAADSSNPSQSIVNKFEPARSVVPPSTPEIPTYSNKAELLQDIKEGKGLFYEVEALTPIYSNSPDAKEAGVREMNINIALAKSIKVIIEKDHGIPLAVSLDGYQNTFSCGFAENIAAASQALLNYVVAVKLKAPDLRETEFGSKHKINEAREKLDQDMDRLKECVTKAGNNYEPLGTLFGEMAEALSARSEEVKSKRREHLGYKLSEDFLSAQVAETDGTLATPGRLTSAEGFLEDLSKKATLKKWTVKKDSYFLNANYDGAPLVIKMAYLPKNDVVVIEGKLRNKKLLAKDILGLTRIVRVN